MTYRNYDLQLTELAGWPNGRAIISAGGAVIVTEEGGASKVDLYDPDNNYQPLANPVSFVRGRLRFATLDTIEVVDCYGMSPTGHAVQLTGVRSDTRQEWFVDTAQRDQVLKVPFSIEDTTDNTETDTGITLPLQASVRGALSSAGILVTVVDASETINVGTAQALTPTPDPVGDADGLQAGVSLTNAVMVNATNGALISSNAPFIATAAVQRRITYTLSTGTDTAQGFIIQPYTLPT